MKNKEDFFLEVTFYSFSIDVIYELTDKDILLNNYLD